LNVFIPLRDWLVENLNIDKDDIYLGIDDKKEYFISTKKRIYFYDFCIRSKKIIIEYHGIGFHANPNWEIDKLKSWKSVFTNESYKTNIEKTKVKNNKAIKKGFKLLEIWGDNEAVNNLNLCKQFIKNNL